MKIESIKLVHAYDRDTGSALLVNGRVIALCNYDDHGSAGSELLESIMENLAAMAGVRPEQDEIDDDEFHELLTGGTS